MAGEPARGHLALVFNIDLTNAMADANAARNLLTGPAGQALGETGFQGRRSRAQVTSGHGYEAGPAQHLRTSNRPSSGRENP